MGNSRNIQETNGTDDFQERKYLNSAASPKIGERKQGKRPFQNGSPK
jgi:hypothetical protein